MSAGIDELLRTTLCLGVHRDEQWVPVGCGFLLSDESMVWLVTTEVVLARAVIGLVLSWSFLRHARISGWGHNKPLLVLFQEVPG